MGANSPAAPAPEALRPPQSWKPSAREEWAKVPPSVQAEVHRREKEAAVGLQESAEARKFHASFQQVTGPYAATIQSEGGNMLQAVGNLLQTAQALRTAPPAHKAQLVASIIQQFGVPIEALDAVLSGQPQQAQQAGGQQQGQYQDPRVDQLFSHLQQAQQQRQQAVATRAQKDIEAFQAKAEFLEDVRPHMAALLADAAQRGQAMTLDEAYERACWADPEVRVYFQRRQAAEAAKATAASTQQARQSALSVRSQPTGSAPAPHSGGSTKDDVLAAMEQLEGRG